jgi:hypothetical protein
MCGPASNLRPTGLDTMLEDPLYHLSFIVELANVGPPTLYYSQEVLSSTPGHVFRCS